MTFVEIIGNQIKEKIMLKRSITLALTASLLNLFLGASIFANTDPEKDAKSAEKVKANIIKLGTGTDAKIEVKLKDGTKLKGHITQINEKSFVVFDEKTGISNEVPYPSVKQAKGHKVSTGVVIAITVGIIIAVVLIFAGASKD